MHRITWSRLGVRGYTLLLCAFIWSLVGYGVWVGAGTGGPGTFHDLLPESVRLAIWWAPALLALLLVCSARWDWIALAALVVGPVLRCLSYLLSWVLYLDGDPGLRSGWYPAAIYLALIGIVGIAAVSHRQPYMGGSGR